MAEEAFASTGNRSLEMVSFIGIRSDLYTYTTEGDPTSGIVVSDAGCMVIDAQVTP
jgi:hypothetical protein